VEEVVAEVIEKGASIVSSSGSGGGGGKGEWEEGEMAVVMMSEVGRLLDRVVMTLEGKVVDELHRYQHEVIRR